MACWRQDSKSYWQIEETMKRMFSAACLVLLAVVLIAASVWAKRALSIDSCLDRGGRWNDEVAACEGG
jgi:hypothetical protein